MMKIKWLHKRLNTNLFRPSSCLALLIMTITGGNAQTDFTATLSRKLNEYVKSFPREEVYIHTDRQAYVAGENIWFSAYAFDRMTLKPLAGKGIVYFEILNPDNRPVFQEKIGIANGKGPGQAFLPDTISSGNYTIRAYTGWMKNFMPDNCFLKEINVYNALKPGNYKKSTDTFNISSKSINPSRQSGPGIKIKRTGNGYVRVEITTSPDYRSKKGIIHYIFVQTRGTMNYTSALNLTGNSFILEIPENLITPGINQVTLFNISGRPVSERYFFTPPEKKSDLKISLRENTGLRQEVTISIDIEDDQLKTPGNTDLSLSVVPAGSDQFPGIADYLVFGSEFGTLPFNLLHSDLLAAAPDTIDLLLDNIRSNWINWETILYGKKPSIRYKKESENHFIYGRLINTRNQAADSGQFVFLSIPGKDPYFQYAITDAEGWFSFSLPLDENTRDLIIQPENPELNNHLEIENPYSLQFRALEKTADSSVTETPSLISKFSINYQVMKIYQNENITGKQEPPKFTPGSRRFYGKPDIEIIMDDYIKLPVMQEVFYELLPGVSLRKKKTEYEITIMDPVDNRILDKPPLVLVDGVVIKDLTEIISLDPELVEKIDVVKTRYFTGEYMFHGIVSIITRAGDFSHFSLPPHAVRIPYRAIDKALPFNAIQYNSASALKSREPDFRNTLYWNPEIKLSGKEPTNLTFWTSDIISEYDIIIQGTSSNGELISTGRALSVQGKQPDN